MNAEVRQLDIGTEVIAYELKRSARKTLGISVTPDGAVHVWWLRQAGFVIKSPGGFTVCIDAYLTESVQTSYGVSRGYPAPLSADESRAWHTLRALRGDHLHRTHRQRRLLMRRRADCRTERIAVVQFRVTGDADDFDLVAHVCLQTATDEIERRTVLEEDVLSGTCLPRRRGG